MSAPMAIILAAGKGTRMGSDLPKVCHEVAGEAMVRHVVRACREAGCGRVVAVVGFRRDLVREALSDMPFVEYAVQDQQLGTGHAVMCAREHLNDRSAEVFVLCGDGPLIHAETLRVMLERHRGAAASATLATSVIEDPSGYGRIVRDGAGRFVAIVEEKNATPEQRRIREVNPSYYCFNAGDLVEALGDVRRNEVSGEYYVTDVPELMQGAGRRVEVIDAVPPEDVLSINTPAQLAEVDRVLRERQKNEKAVG